MSSFIQEITEGKIVSFHSEWQQRTELNGEYCG